MSWELMILLSVMTVCGTICFLARWPSKDPDLEPYAKLGDLNKFSEELLRTTTKVELLQQELSKKGLVIADAWNMAKDAQKMTSETQLAMGFKRGRTP